MSDNRWGTAKLSEVAEVVSGVAKGRKLNGNGIRHVPYLRVANVQAGHLDLTEVKTIPATFSEIQTLKLELGDVVMTEGGDHDKLGRGAIWDKDIADCIHQNHVFRVRTNRKLLLPRFLAKYLQTQEAKSYFLRCAKKTTNLASINMTQLRALPVPVPPLPDQRRIAAILDKADGIRRKRQEAIQLAEQFLRSAFLDMFGDPVTNAKEWSVRPLSEIADVNRGKFTPRPRTDPRYYGGEHPFIQTGQLTGCNGILKGWKQTLSEEGTKVSRRFPKGTKLCHVDACQICCLLRTP